MGLDGMVDRWGGGSEVKSASTESIEELRRDEDSHTQHARAQTGRQMVGKWSKSCISHPEGLKAQRHR